ncbi:extracellular solute-binding protein [Roseibium aggregatum]|uniref:ABC transporter substrate-binding protein n=1 Tax=Roseibium aggregatum TaxID=187304 RepID=A0A939IZZ9_9HYPH|nr:extracellular solute-binding protein [Roseibium aggregatum]MBN9670586.1 ABC transporter substrate-binding protein [Roseibium aggregatum]
MAGRIRTFIAALFHLKVHFLLAAAVCATVPALPMAAEDTALPWTHAISMHGTPALAPDEPFPYVDPDAPRGGTLTLGVQGTFDSLNSFIVQGGWTSARGMRERQFGNNILESLMVRSYAEPFSLYGLLAQQVRMPDSREWIEFELNPAARFSDGTPVTVEDIIFSLEIIRDKGRPPYRTWYGEIVKKEVTGPNRLKLFFRDGENRELPLLIALAPIFSKKHTDAATFDKSSLTPPVGSGPYTFKTIEPGRLVVYEKNTDYWARDLAVKTGFDNFDEIRIEYFRDETTLQEAFKKGLIDALQFRDPARWATGFDFPAAENGDVTRLEIPLGVPAAMQGIAFNTRRQQFSDRNVRKALRMLFDFNWVNRNLYHGLYTRTAGYWDNSELSSIGRPASAREKALLAPFPDAVDPDTLAGTWRPADADGSGRDRKVLRAALEEFGKAGYGLKDRKLVNRETGQALAFEILAKNEDEEKLALTYIRTLELLGIDASVRSVDPSQFEDRRTKREFDMVFNTWTASLSPGAEQYGRWSSKAADTEGSFNFVGAKEPAIDALIDAIVGARSREDFVDAVRAFDRVLISGAYAVPLYHVSSDWVAHWNKVAPPQHHSLYGHEFDTWWSSSAQ